MVHPPPRVVVLSTGSEPGRPRHRARLRPGRRQQRRHAHRGLHRRGRAAVPRRGGGRRRLDVPAGAARPGSCGPTSS
nr:hypothetical protein [Angustibacter aerolatus]